MHHQHEAKTAIFVVGCDFDFYSPLQAQKKESSRASLGGGGGGEASSIADYSLFDVKIVLTIK